MMILEGRGGGREVGGGLKSEGRTYVYLQLIHTDVQ